MLYVPIQFEEGAVDHWTLSNSVHIVRRAIRFTFSFASFSQLNISLLILHRIVKLELHLSTLVKRHTNPIPSCGKLDRYLFWETFHSLVTDFLSDLLRGQLKLRW